MNIFCFIDKYTFIQTDQIMGIKFQTRNFPMVLGFYNFVTHSKSELFTIFYFLELSRIICVCCVNLSASILFMQTDSGYKISGHKISEPRFSKGTGIL